MAMLNNQRVHHKVGAVVAMLFFPQFDSRGLSFRASSSPASDG